MERKTPVLFFLFLVGGFVFISFLTLLGCSSNPFGDTNRGTATAAGTLVGAGVGAGGAALLAAPKSVIALAGIGGAAVGYYVTTLRYASGGVVQASGQVYTLGEYVGIEIPSDKLFDSNSADFLPEATSTLDSVVAVLKRYPDRHILVSGNTSGFGSAKWEQTLSEDRARQVASFLWAHGILNRSEFANNQFQAPRQLTYVGYGNYMPIANHITDTGVRANSRIQITVYPTSVTTPLSKQEKVFGNIGRTNEKNEKNEPAISASNGESDYTQVFSDDVPMQA